MSISYIQRVQYFFIFFKNSLAEKEKQLYLHHQNAEVAQLVEHNLAKVRVAGSNPVFRSKLTEQSVNFFSAGGEIGRHATLRG